MRQGQKFLFYWGWGWGGGYIAGGDFVGEGGGSRNFEVKIKIA